VVAVWALQAAAPAQLLLLWVLLLLTVLLNSIQLMLAMLLK
jgi:hypothetical protein